RGMGYYTGQVFEIIHPEMSGSVAGGGRYDRLIGRSLGKDVPACGFSIGFERIVDLLDSAPRVDTVAVLHEADVSRPRCWPSRGSYARKDARSRPSNGVASSAPSWAGWRNGATPPSCTSSPARSPASGF